MHEVHTHTQIFWNQIRGSDSVLAQWAVGGQIDGATVWQTGGCFAKRQAIRRLQRVLIQTVSAIVSVSLSVCVSGACQAVWGPDCGGLPVQTVDFGPRGWRIQHSLM